MRALLLLLLMALAASAAPGRARPKTYVVVYEIRLGEGGRIESMKIERVIDPANGRTPEEAADRPVDVAVPESYLAKVRRELQSLYRGKAAGRFYTFTIYDPARPDETNPGAP